MNLLSKPITHIGLGVLFLALDFVSGSWIQFPIAFPIPVVLAAWYSRPIVGYLLAISMPVIRLCFVFFWEHPTELNYLIINFIIRLVVLVFIAHIVQKTARLTQEVKVLKGILPVCSFCKKIQDKSGNWQKIETYISHRSEAKFSHGFCPECAKIHYGDLLDDEKK